MKSEARDRLVALIDTTKAADLHNLTPEDAVADVIHEAFRNQPSLRNCLFPGCFREFDMAARMEGREPERPSWSGEGWHQARGISPGVICPDHVSVVTDHLASAVDLPNGRWTLSCACGWMPRPQDWSGFLRSLWEHHVLTAAGALPVPETPAETLERIPLDQHTEDTLTELYEQLQDGEADRSETRDAAQAMYKSWDWHRRILGGAAQAVTALCNQLRFNSRDWAADRGDAYLWAVLIGWDDDVLAEVAAKHGWNEYRVKYVRELRAGLAPLTDPQPKED